MLFKKGLAEPFKSKKCVQTAKVVSYYNIMELSFKELKKREVINISDGRSLGFMTDMTLSFPSGKLSSITVPGKKSSGIFSCFSKNSIIIEENRIMKIGNDVILVNLKDGCHSSTNIDLHKSPPNKKPNREPPCDKPFSGGIPTVSELFGDCECEDGTDLSDY